MHDHLGIAAGCEVVARARQLLAQLTKVIDLAVKDQLDHAILVGHRLVAAGQIDNRQAAHSHTNMLADIKAIAIRPTMMDRMIHSLDQAALNRARPIGMQMPTDTAHRYTTSFGSAAQVRIVSWRNISMYCVAAASHEKNPARARDAMPIRRASPRSAARCRKCATSDSTSAQLKVSPFTPSSTSSAVPP